MSLLTFDQVIEKAITPHLLLGNGFSIAYDSKRFSFTTLLESAIRDQIIEAESPIATLFDKLKTADFESVMKSLDESSKILETYEPYNTDLLDKLNEDSKNLKKYLVKIITNNHPENSNALSDSERASCKRFLQHFEKGSIYTLNYDLLLYWVFVDMEDVRNDGFLNTKESKKKAYVVYQNQKSFDIHYLHGGLHLFDAGKEIIKKTYANSGETLIDQITENLKDDIYPIFISEGGSNQKMTKIIHNAYLNHCFKSIKGLSKTKDLVIFGTYLKSNDDHIFNALLESNVQNIYLGCSSLESPDVLSFKARIDNYNERVPSAKQKKLLFYDYKTVKVWDNDTEIEDTPF